MTLLTTAFISAGLAACSATPARPAHSLPGPATSSLLSLSCPDSVGQQGADHETVTGGVEGLLLPGSDDPAGLYPIGTASGGKRYFIYKAFLAVSASAAPFATVSITHPASARLVYGSSSRIGALFSTRSGQPLLAASRTKVRLPVCGPRFTGFTGGVIVPGPACVTFEVSSPSTPAVTVTVPSARSSAQSGSPVTPGSRTACTNARSVRVPDQLRRWTRRAAGRAVDCPADRPHGAWLPA